MPIAIARLLGCAALALILTIAVGGSAEASKSKSFDFDVSVSQFKEDCELAGGTYDYENGTHSCLFDDWHMECSRSRDTCTIYCDPGTPCVEKKRSPRGVRDGIKAIVRLADRQVAYAR